MKKTYVVRGGKVICLQEEAEAKRCAEAEMFAKMEKELESWGGEMRVFKPGPEYFDALRAVARRRR